MSQTLLLSWDRRRVSGLVVDEEGNPPRCVGTFTLPWPEDFDPLANPALTAERLKKALPTKASPQRTIVCLSREDVILRHLEVPEVPDEELPAMVAFQAAARSTLPLEQLLLDFFPLRRSPGREGRPVLAVTASKPLVLGIQAVLRDVAGEADAFSFSSLGIAELVLQREQRARQDPNRSLLCLVPEQGRVELVILDDRQILQAHATHASTGIPAEVSRTLVAARQQNPGLSIQQVWLLGHAESEKDALLSQVSERVGAPADFLKVAHVDWLEGDIHDVPVPLLGLAVGQAIRLSPPFDFLHPRRPPRKINLRKLRLAVASAAALFIAVVVMGAQRTTLARLEQTKEQLLSQEADLDVQIGPGKGVLEAAQLISKWEAGDINQLEHLATLEELMEGTQQMYLTQYSFLVGQGDSPPTLQSFGNARTREDVVRFNQRLSDTKRYRIHPRGLTQQSRDDEYPHRFELSADLLPPAPSTAVPAAAIPQNR